MKYAGSTANAGGKFLGSPFWKKGVQIEGTVTGQFATSSGPATSLKLFKGVSVDGKSEDNVSIGNMKGFLMAVRAAGVPNGELKTGDSVLIRCTGFEKNDKPGYSDMVLFEVVVDRPDKGKF